MDEPNGGGQEPDFSDGDDPVVPPFNPVHSDSKEDSNKSGHNGAVGHNETEKTRSFRQKRRSAYWRKLRRAGPDRHIELALSGAIMLFALIQLVATAMNNSSTSKQVDKIIATAGSIQDSASQITQASWRFSGAAQGINNAGWNAFGQLKLQAQQMEQSRSVSDADAKHSLDATIENFHQEQRAWVGFGGFVIQPDPIRSVQGGDTPDAASVAVSYMVNSGRTPARHVEGVTGLAFMDRSHVLDKTDENWMSQTINEIWKGTIPPNPVWWKMRQQLLYGATSPSLGDTSLTKIEIGSLASGVPEKFVHPTNWYSDNPDKVVVLFGEIRYFDVYSQSIRTTSFCAYRPQRVIPELDACPVFNNMD